MKEKLLKIGKRIQDSKTLINVRSGLVNTMPVILVGAFCLIISTFIGYSESDSTVLANICKVMDLIYKATFGILAVIVTISISAKCMENKSANINQMVGILTAVVSFFILNGGFEAAVKTEAIGVKGMFTAIAASLVATYLYEKIAVIVSRFKLIFLGGDFEFQGVVNSLAPFILTVFILSIFNVGIQLISGLDSFNALFVWIIDNTVVNMGRNIFSGFVFILLLGISWSFGVHGNNILEPMVEKLFTPVIHVNESIAASGGVPTEILSKTFFDVFVFMGGCGTTLALLIAIILFSKNRKSRNIAYAASGVMIFNVNEIMVFGLPIVLNPIMIIPFLITPIVCYFISYFAIYMGIVPVPVSEVTWTMPVLASGYMATHSIAGSMLQIFNLAVGVFIYKPFINFYDNSQQNNAVEQMNKLTNVIKDAENLGKSVNLLSRKDDVGMAAKYFLSELDQAISMENLKMFYQPQYNENDECTGVEALLRYKTDMYGYIYPPLIIHLAREGNKLMKLEKYVYMNVAKDIDTIYNAVGRKIKISVNVTPETFLEEEFANFMRGFAYIYDREKADICIEVTEQTHLEITDRVEQTFEKLHNMGYKMSIDDFSMGSTSIKYLKKNYFDEVKLDGNLIVNINGEGNEKEIVASVLALAKSLNISVVAEYTENREIQRQLKELGCVEFQGYLYSPAVEAHELKRALREFEESGR